MNTDQLLKKLNAAVKAANSAEAELVSRSKEVGLLLLEAKKLHPAVKDFEAFLKRVNGLKLSRAYDLLRLAGGRTTDEELRKEARERKQKSRERQKLPKPEPKPLPKPAPTPISVTSRKSAEVSIEQRRAENAALDNNAEEIVEEFFSVEEKESERWLNEFKTWCRGYLSRMTEDDRLEALLFVQDCNRELSPTAKKTKAA